MACCGRVRVVLRRLGGTLAPAWGQRSADLTVIARQSTDKCVLCEFLIFRDKAYIKTTGQGNIQRVQNVVKRIFRDQMIYVVQVVVYSIYAL